MITEEEIPHPLASPYNPSAQNSNHNTNNNNSNNGGIIIRKRSGTSHAQKSSIKANYT